MEVREAADPESLVQLLKQSHHTPVLSLHVGKKYDCNHCDYKDTTKSHLTTHRQSIHEHKKYICNTCIYHIIRVTSPNTSSQFMLVRNITVTNVTTKQHRRPISPHTSHCMLERNMTATSASTKQQRRAVSPNTSSQFTLERSTTEISVSTKQLRRAISKDTNSQFMRVESINANNAVHSLH